MKHPIRTLTLSATIAAIAAPAFAQDLTMWSWRQEDRAVYEDLIAAFEAEHPGITVSFEAFEASSYATILSTALAGESGPDIMMVRAYGAFEAVAGADYLLPISMDDVPGLAGMNQNAVAAQTLRADGMVYGVPFASQTMLVIYNRGIYEDLGLEEPSTWDELVANAEAIREAGMFPFANGTATAWQNETIVSVFGSSTIGLDFYNEVVDGTTDFTDPRFVAGLEKVQEISAYFPDGFTGLDYPSSQQLFASGLAAMFAGGSFEIANFRNQNPDLDIGVFPAPADSADTPALVGVFFDGGYAGNAGTEHPEAVMEFLEYTATTEFGQVFANALGNITPIPGVTIEDPLFNEIAQLNQNSAPYIMLTNFRYEEPSGSVLLQAEVQRMLAGESTPEEAAQTVNDGIATYYEPFQ